MASNLLDLPRLNASLVTDPLHEAYNALVDCIERRIRGYHSSKNLYYETLYGLLLMSGQSFGAISILVHDSAGDRSFPVQAAILARAMLEGLGNVLVLREAPEERARLFALSTARDLRRNLEAKNPRFTSPRWVAWAEQQAKQLEWWKALVRITPQEWDALPRWPAASGLGACLTLSAAEVWELLYLAWYSLLSAPVHQTGLATILAIQRHNSRGEERQALRQDPLLVATIAHACTVTEACASTPALGLPIRQLQATWEHLRRWSPFADEVYGKRYRGLLDGL